MPQECSPDFDDSRIEGWVAGVPVVDGIADSGWTDCDGGRVRLVVRVKDSPEQQRMGARHGARWGLRQGGAGVGRATPPMEKSPAACVSRPSATEQTIRNPWRIEMSEAQGKERWPTCAALRLTRRPKRPWIFQTAEIFALAQRVGLLD